jgi:L-iditol 2-dehydrogenase
MQVLGGATVCVTDLSTDRLAVAQRLGAHAVFDPRAADVVQAMRDWTDGEGVDLVVDAVGAAATKKQSLQVTRPGGAAVWIGLHENAVTVDTYEITLPERFVFGTYAAKIEELAQALDLMAAGKVDVTSWVQTFPLAQGVPAFERMLAAQGADIKAVIKP